MTTNRFCLPWLLLMFLAPCLVSATPRLSVLGGKTNSFGSEFPIPAETQENNTFYYTQTLDHFNYRPDSYATFQQRYVVSSRDWGGANTSSPIFVYLGAEAPIGDHVTSIGFLPDHAPQFKALIVFIEHRYYGKSMPFGSGDEAFKNASTLGYLSSAQALADYAEVITYLKKNLSAESSPVIVFGGSYGGMLASWFRIKYPHVALGALASSAPILYFDHITPDNGYYAVVSKNYKEASKSCYKTIRRSWSEIDRVAAKPDGLAILSQKFKTCSRLNNSFELKDYLDFTYALSSQYSRPPEYEYAVATICEAIDGAPNGTSILDRIFSGLVAYEGEAPCYDLSVSIYQSGTLEGWEWQTCTEMVMRIGHGKDSMFQVSPFDIHAYSRSCQRSYGIKPRPHWIVSEFGGQDIKKVLGKFASNIIFSNGLRDPYSSGGVVEDISDSIVALTTTNGSHCMDIIQQTPNDPVWLVEQRKAEVEIIQRWLTEYHTATPSA